MNGQLKTEMRPEPLILMLLGMLLLSAGAIAQVPVDEYGNPVGTFSEDAYDDERQAGSTDELLSAAALEELVGPVALYPDDLLAIVLPASTYPLEIVQAARFLEQLENDSSLKPEEEWDESVVALLNYPEVVRMLDEDIDWTWQLGEAVLNQQNDVIAAVESFRDRAYAAGNLKSDEYQEVKQEDGIIEIVPVEDEIIYVPYYEPAEVVVYQPRRVYYYYPDPYPVYYYPYPAGYRFHSGFFWGVTTAFTIGWSNHYLHVYHPSYWGHPYYGHYYYGHYYRHPSITVYNTYYVNNNYQASRYRYRDGDYWRPRTRAGSRPDSPRVRNYHFSPNGSSNNSRDFTVSRQDRLRVSDDGRMDLRLRERDRNATTANVARNQAAAIRGTSDRLNRASDARNTNSRNATQSSSNSRGRRVTGPASGGESPATSLRPNQARAAAGETRLRREATNRISRDRQPAVVNAGQSRLARSGNVRSSPDRPRTVPGTSANRETRPSVSRSAATPRATAPAVRRSIPAVRNAAPPSRAQAPAIQQRAPSAPARQESRSNGRSEAGGSTPGRSRSSARVRSNN